MDKSVDIGLNTKDSKCNPRLATFLLALCMFTTGACGLVAEYVLSTVSTYILGNSIEQFSVIIALMMLMMGIAGFVQRFISEKNLVEKFIYTEICLALLVGFSPIGIYAAFGFMESHFELVLYSVVMMIGFLIGLEIPLVMRINEKFSQTLGVNMSNVYAPDYIGSFVGAIFWTYILLRNFPLTEISFIMAGFNFAIAIVAILYFVRHNMVTRVGLTAFSLMVTGMLLIYGYANNVQWNTNLEQRLYEDKIILGETTKYQRIIVTYNKSINDYRLYLNGNLQFSSTDEAIYHEQLVHPAMSLAPCRDNILVLGGGDGLALREILKYKDVKTIKLIDLDPDMVQIAKTNKVFKALNRNSFGNAKVYSQTSDGVIDTNQHSTINIEVGNMQTKRKPETQPVAEVTVYNIDADKFLNSVSTTKWNIVIIDFPDPNSIELAKLYSKEFFLKLKRVINYDSLVVIQSTSPYHAKEAYLCINRTMQAAGFATILYHDNVPSFGDWGWILAKLRNKPDTSNINISVPTRYLTRDVFLKSMIFGKNWLESKYTDISTLMNPVILQRYVHESWVID